MSVNLVDEGSKDFADIQGEGACSEDFTNKGSEDLTAASSEDLFDDNGDDSEIFVVATITGELPRLFEEN